MEAYAYYIETEKRAKKVDTLILIGLYERAITEADKRRFDGEENAEMALRTFWLGYLDHLVSHMEALSNNLFITLYHLSAHEFCQRKCTSKGVPSRHPQYSWLWGSLGAIHSVLGTRVPVESVCMPLMKSSTQEMNNMGDEIDGTCLHSC